jgi:integrase
VQVFLVPRKKGGRRAKRPRAGQWYPLLPPAIVAIRDYDAAGLWGRAFARRAMARMWKTAIVNARIAAAEIARETGDSTILDALVQYVPINCRPYDLRHSFLSETYRVSKDPRTVRTVGQLSPNSKTWERYTVAVVPENVEAAFAKMAERWTGEAPPPAPLTLVGGKDRR